MRRGAAQAGGALVHGLRREGREERPRAREHSGESPRPLRRDTADAPPTHADARIILIRVSAPTFHQYDVELVELSNGREKDGGEPAGKKKKKKKSKRIEL